MEKIKDFFYYIGDFLVCILILSAMYFLITWKLDETMPIDVNADDKTAVTTDESILQADLDNTNQDLVGKDVEDDNKDKQQNQVTEDEQGDQKISDQDMAESQTDQTNQPDDTTEVDKDETPDESSTEADNNSVEDGSYNGGTTSNAEVIFTVSAGMSGQDIANGLQAQGVIADSREFINKLEELDLSSSLLAGDFELRQGMDYETVISILTGRN